MGRFSNLEFGSNVPPGEEERGPLQEARDERYYLRLADGEYRGARFEKALRYYSRALEFNANTVAAWMGQVQMLLELGEYKEARMWADKALEVHRDHPDILSAKAVAWARLGDAQRALEFSDAAVAQKGTSPLLWLARGEALLAGRKPNDEFCFEKADAEAGHEWFMQLRIARVCHFYGQFPRAMTWITKALQQEPASPFVFHVQGECQLALGIVSAAGHSFRQALSLDPAFELSRAALGRFEDRGFLTNLWARLSSWFR